MGNVHNRIAAISPLAHVEESVTDIVVTDLTIGGTELEHVDDLLVTQLAHKGLVADHPAQSAGTEESEAVVLGEFLRAVVSTVVLKEVAVVPIIGSTEHPVLTIAWDHGADGIFLTGEGAHAGDMMQSEGTRPVELYLIVEVALGIPVLYCTLLDFPFLAHGVVKAVIVLVGFLISHLSGLRVDPFELWVVVLVFDASVSFHKGVVPRHGATCRKSFGDEVEFLLQDKVGGDAGGCGLHRSVAKGNL